MIFMNEQLRKRNSQLENQNQGLITEIDALDVPKPIFASQKKASKKKKLVYSSSERSINVNSKSPNSPGRKSQQQPQTNKLKP